MEQGSLLHGHTRIRDAAIEATRKPPNPQSYFCASHWTRYNIIPVDAYISIMLAITKTSAINPKELARIHHTEHVDALYDEG
jgi:hypothetical protein